MIDLISNCGSVAAAYSSQNPNNQHLVKESAEELTGGCFLGLGLIIVAVVIFLIGWASKKEL